MEKLTYDEIAKELHDLKAKMLPDDLKARTAKILDNPESLDTICINVASGGSLIDLCETWDVRYAEVWNWINKDKERAGRYADALNARNEWAREAILRELRLIGMADVRKLYDDIGNLLPVDEWPTEVAKFVSSFEVDELWEGKGPGREQIGFTKKVKVWNKERALELLGKNIQMFNEHHTVSGKLSLEDLINEAIKDPDEQ